MSELDRSWNDMAAETAAAIESFAAVLDEDPRAGLASGIQERRRAEEA